MSSVSPGFFELRIKHHVCQRSFVRLCRYSLPPRSKTPSATATLDGERLVFWQASAYRPITENVVDEEGHVVGKLILKTGLTNLCMAGNVTRTLVYFACACEDPARKWAGQPTVTTVKYTLNDCVRYACSVSKLPDLFSQVSDEAGSVLADVVAWDYYGPSGTCNGYATPFDHEPKKNWISDVCPEQVA